MDRARRVNLSIRGCMGDEKGRIGGGPAGVRTHGPGGLKAVNVEKSDRVRAVRWLGRGSKPRSTITTRESNITRVVHRWCARCNVERPHISGIGAKHTRGKRERER